MSHTNPLDPNFVDYTQWLNTVPSESPASAAGSSYNSVAPIGEPGTPNPYDNPLVNYNDSNANLYANMTPNQLCLFLNVPSADGMEATRAMGSTLYQPDQPVAARQDNVSINWAGAGADPLLAAQMTTRDTFAPQAPNQGSSGGAYQSNNTGAYQSNNVNAYEANNASTSYFNNASTHHTNYAALLQNYSAGNTAGISSRGFPDNNVGNSQSDNANTYQSLNASTYSPR